MMESLQTVSDSELLARVIFPPQMILDGKVMPAAFVLRPSINEEYLSVLRIAVPSFNQDMKKSLYGRKRTFYGFAVMNVFMQLRAETKLVWAMPRPRKGRIKSNYIIACSLGGKPNSEN